MRATTRIIELNVGRASFDEQHSGAMARGGAIVDDRVWKKIYNLVQKADGASVRVGLPDGELAEIGLIHEYGAPKAGIPERSFIRQTFRNKRPQLIALQGRLAGMIMTGKITPERAMDILGAWLSGAIKATITSDGHFVPLAPATVKAKGSSKPLVDHGDLSRAVTWRVVK